MILEGKIVASQTTSAKFSISGKLDSLRCKPGDTVKKGQLLASLDKGELQTYLDRALKQYDIERALFDEKQKENLTDYEKRKFQDSLDISVKNVELAKINVDATNLYASINGIVTQIDNSQPGDYITPAGFVITIVNPESLYFQAIAQETDIPTISVNMKGKIKLKAFPDRTIEGSIKIGFYEIKVIFPSLPELKEGLSGTVEF